MNNKNGKTANKKGLHPKNIHQRGYHFPELIKCYPPLAKHVIQNSFGKLSLNYADSSAVVSLNTALLKTHYNVINWQIPEGALCPPIPGRADYIHYVAELLAKEQGPKANTHKIKMLDIGTGANGIYPILASQICGWECVASDINKHSLENVSAILANNPKLNDKITLRYQENKHQIFKGIIQPTEFFDISVCNPPFHSSEEEAMKGSQRKLQNLERNKNKKNIKTAPVVNNVITKHIDKPALNFGGLAAELWCNGGEQLFLKKLIKESKDFSQQCRWFTSLVSKAENLKPLTKLLRKLGAVEIKEIPMVQGNKVTRVLAWTYIG